jgi:hypothetical protein
MRFTGFELQCTAVADTAIVEVSRVAEKVEAALMLMRGVTPYATSAPGPSVGERLIPTPILESTPLPPPSTSDGLGAFAAAAGWGVAGDEAAGTAIAIVELSDCAKDEAGHKFIKPNRSRGAANIHIRNLILLN